MARRGVRLIITGRVQGVFFRATAKRRAQELGLNGYVRNLPDDTVEAVVAGPEEDVEKFVSFCREGSPAARVENVEVSTLSEEELPQSGDFEIRY